MRKFQGNYDIDEIFEPILYVPSIVTGKIEIVSRYSIYGYEGHTRMSTWYLTVVNKQKSYENIK